MSEQGKWILRSFGLVGIIVVAASEMPPSVKAVVVLLLILEPAFATYELLRKKTP